NFVTGYQHSTYGGRVKPPPGNNPHHGHGHGHGQSMLELDRKPDTNSIIPLPTNYEKDIPAHAYPIPPHRYALTHGAPPHLSHHGMLEPKLEDMGMLGHGHGHGGGGYTYLGDGKPLNNGFSCCRQGGTRPPTAEHLKDGTCLGLGIQPKEELLDEDELVDAHNGMKGGAGKAKGKQKPDEIPEIIVKHEKINPLFDTTDRLEEGNPRGE
ncbi:GL24721, partial [Drosophila persimilis]